MWSVITAAADVTCAAATVPVAPHPGQIFSGTAARGSSGTAAWLPGPVAGCHGGAGGRDDAGDVDRRGAAPVIRGSRAVDGLAAATVNGRPAACGLESGHQGGQP
jgi:hypothetical protein